MIFRLRALLIVGCVLSSLPVASFGQEIRPPLHTSGHDIRDAAGHRVRLTSVNWYGFDQKEFVAGGLDVAALQVIIEQIRAVGVNSVRLPWANETLWSCCERLKLLPTTDRIRCRAFPRKV